MVRLSTGGDILQSTFVVSNGPATAYAMNVQSGGGYVAVSTGVEQLGILRIGPNTAGTAGTALGCYGNGATFLGGPLAPGEVFSMSGEGLGPAAGATIQWRSNQPAGASLGGVTVTFDGMPAPLLYVQSSQVNAIVPWEIAGKSETELCVSYGGRNSCTTAPVAPASPGIFQYAGPDWAPFRPRRLTAVSCICRFRTLLHRCRSHSRRDCLLGPSSFGHSAMSSMPGPRHWRLRVCTRSTCGSRTRPPATVL